MAAGRRAGGGARGADDSEGHRAEPPAPPHAIVHVESSEVTAKSTATICMMMLSSSPSRPRTTGIGEGVEERKRVCVCDDLLTD